jgi:predicted transcriptional regulator
MTPPDPLGSLLAHLRAGASVSGVAAALKVARETIYQWEGGTKRPSPENLGALIKHYGCDEATELRLWRLRSGADGAAVEVAA